jgi:hypothetical protein
MKIVMEFHKADDHTRKISVVLNKDHEMVEALHTEIMSRMVALEWEQCNH